MAIRTPLSSAPQFVDAPGIHGLSSAQNPPEEDGPLDTLRWASGGNILQGRFSRPKVGQHNRQGGGRRGRITVFSRKSRKSMLNFANSLNMEQLTGRRCAIVTLTYPEAHPDDPAQWHRDLDRFRKRLERKWGAVGTVRKLEPQARNVPHWHLVIVLNEEIRSHFIEFRDWVASTWFNVCRSGDARHQAAGTQVAYCRDVRATLAYLSKEGPDFIDPATGELTPVGRRWGIWHRDLWPVEWCEVAVPRPQWMQVRRAIRRFLGCGWLTSVTSYCVFVPSRMAERLVEWASSGC